jgi:hypothetical protein
MTDGLELRVRVLDAWDDVVMQLPASTLIADVKRRALEAAHITGDPAGFLVKFRGAEVRDESRSLADERVPGDGALIVMRRRRVPVR